MKKILVVLTGGTICSTKDENYSGKNQSNAEKIKTFIINDYLSSNSPFTKKVKFDTISLVPDILSENMTAKSLTALLKILRPKRIWTKYQGVIILHGTDTLAYTSSVLSIVLAGAPIPIMMVSAQKPLLIDGEKNNDSNGFINFKVSIELILNGIKPNVYAVYRNDDNKTYLHYGANLLQCQNYSDNFYSKKAILIDETTNAKFDGEEFETNEFYIKDIKKITDGVINVFPYTCLDYSKISIKGVKAIVHGTYHSDTVCVERKDKKEGYGKYSILYLLDRAKKKNIPVFLAPCDEKAYFYASTGDAIENGCIPISYTTKEFAYAKVLVGVSLKLSGEELVRFVNNSVNHEFVYKK